MATVMPKKVTADDSVFAKLGLWSEYISGPAMLFGVDVRDFTQGLVIDTAVGLYHLPGRVAWRMAGATDRFEDLDPTWDKYFQNNFARSREFTDNPLGRLPIAALDVWGQTTQRTVEVANVLIDGLWNQSGIPSLLYGATGGKLGKPAPGNPRELGQLFGADLVLIGGMRLTPKVLARKLNALEDIIKEKVPAAANRKLAPQMGTVGDWVGAMKNKAGIALKHQRFKEAAEAYRELIDLETLKSGRPSPITVTNLGIAFRGAGKLVEAKQALEWAIRLGEHPRTLCELTIVLRWMREYNDALATIDRAIEIEGATRGRSYCERGITLREMEKLDESLAAIDRAIALEHSTKGRSFCERGITLRDMGKLDESLAAIDKAIGIDGMNRSRYFCERGITLRKMGRPGDSLAAINRAIELEPSAQGRHFSEQGFTLRQMDRLQEAKESMEKALHLNEQSGLLYPMGNLTLAEILLALGEFDQAAVVLHRCIEALESVGRNYPPALELLTEIRAAKLEAPISELARVMRENRLDLEAILRGLSANHGKKLGIIYRYRITPPKSPT